MDMNMTSKKQLSYFFRNDGVAAVEFALVAPFLLLLLIGLYDLGSYMNQKMRLENAARAAAEYVNQGGDEADLQSDIVLLTEFSASSESLDTLQMETEYVCECTGGAVVDCDTGTCDDGSGDTDTYMRRYFLVNLNMTMQPVIPYPGLPGALGLSGDARIQVQ